jgi:HPr kinase/phosphorylase
MKKSFSVLDLLKLDLRDHDSLELRCIAGRQGLSRIITVPDLNRPGLALSGFFDNFASERIQIFGKGEHSYVEKLDREGVSHTIKLLFKQKIPCAIFTHDLDPQPMVLEQAKASQTPILQTNLTTSEFSSRIIRALSNIFAKIVTKHGVLVEVFGIGILIMGESGVGKSETALELIHRGHRLVADDAVEIRNVAGTLLIGRGANKSLGHHMEIRGLGIINITHMFGVGAIRETKQIQLIVELELWDSNKVYDRIGAEERTREISGVNIPHLLVPVKPGRNIPIIIETAAMNERLKKMGYFSAKEFNQSVMKWLETENARNNYLEKQNVLESLKDQNKKDSV